MFRCTVEHSLPDVLARLSVSRPSVWLQVIVLQQLLRLKKNNSKFYNGTKLAVGLRKLDS